MPLIEVKNLTKQFDVYKRPKGFVNGLKSIFSREYERKLAVNDISFSINKGELVGYIGPNGAGKSTTIKMLAGILHPTFGSVQVNNIVPHLNRRENAMRIGVVFGQRSQLYWNLPMEETFQLYKKIYKINNADYIRNVDFYIELLELGEFLRTPVRQLSLGQRMRGELANSLLHDPDILYLDEPTIGLDVIVKRKIRDFIKALNKEKRTTVILTTHDMDDIEQICGRLITIDKGQIVYDGNIDSFKEMYGSGKMLVIDFLNETQLIDNGNFVVVKEEGGRKWISLTNPNYGAGEAVTFITNNYEIGDIKIIEPLIEDAVKKIYNTRTEGVIMT